MTHQEIWGQFYLFVISLVFGAVIAFFYDSVRAVRCGLFRKTHKILRFMGDCIYGLAAGITGFGILFWENDGELRFYPFLGLVLGYCLYEFLIGKYYRYYLARTLRFFRKKAEGVCRVFCGKIQKNKNRIKTWQTAKKNKRLEKRREKNREKEKKTRERKKKERTDGTKKSGRKKSQKGKGEKAADHRI